MKQAIIVAVLLTIASGVQADFTLTGTQHRDVSSYDYKGYLYDSSTVDVLAGGLLSRIYAYDTSTANIFAGGEVEGFYAYEASTLNMSGGSMDLLTTYDSSKATIAGGSVSAIQAFNLGLNAPQRINITSGTVGTLFAKINVVGNEHLGITSDLTLSDLSQYGVDAVPGTVGVARRGIMTYDTSTVDISGGYTHSLFTYDTSAVNMSAGNIPQLEVMNLRVNGPQRVNITGGTVETLSSYIDVVGNEHFSYADLSDLTAVGVQAAPGTVSNFSTIIRPNENSTVDISGGSVYWLEARGASITNVSGGSVDLLDSYETSTVDISSGSVDGLGAWGTSAVDISGGIVNGIWSGDTSTITFNGYDFLLGSGLSWGADGQTILGKGYLSGKWFGSTDTWTTYIGYNESTSTIIAVPEPATLALFGLGGLLLRKRRK